MAICSVSVDLDPVACYTRIHGLPDPTGADPVYASAVQRFFDLFGEHSIQATLFVIGRDLETEIGVEKLRVAVELGHELGNHTHDHPYDLPGLDPVAAEHQVRRCHDLLKSEVGVDCVGFRAPGYNIDERTVSLLERLGYVYDSSVFPSPPYYLAKGAVMLAIKARGGRSGSAMVRARTQIAPTTPYRPRRSAIHRRAQEGDRASVFELPICVLPVIGAPVIGTTLVMAGAKGARALIRAAALRHREFLNIELHGIDLADADADGYDPQLVARQPDLRRSGAAKRAALSAAFDEAARLGYRFETCVNAARLLAA